jgi:hypothetical protein
VFDDPNLVSSAGLVPVLALANSDRVLTTTPHHRHDPTPWNIAGSEAGRSALPRHREFTTTPARAYLSSPSVDRG